MEIPRDVKTYELRNSIIFFDEYGIMYSKPKPEMPQQPSNEELISEVNKILEITGGKKVSIVVETDPRSPAPAKEQRDLIAEQMDKVVKAMAIITTSAVSRMIVNLFFLFKPPGYPAKMFTDVDKAVAWLKELDNHKEKTFLLVA